MLSRRDFGVGAIATATALGLTTVAVAQPAGGAALGRMRRIGVMLPIPGNDPFLLVLRWPAKRGLGRGRR